MVVYYVWWEVMWVNWYGLIMFLVVNILGMMVCKYLLVLMVLLKVMFIFFNLKFFNLVFCLIVIMILL